MLGQPACGGACLICSLEDCFLAPGGSDLCFAATSASRQVEAGQTRMSWNIFMGHSVRCAAAQNVPYAVYKTTAEGLCQG